MDMSSVIAFLARHQWTIIFYTLMIALIVAFRKRIEWQAFGVGMYKTKVGLKLMEKLGTKYRGWVRIFGYIAIGLGFVGMAYITGALIYGVWSLIFRPEAPSVIQPVIPGVTFPGQEIAVPLITGWIALFLLIIIHEFSHGVVARAHDIPVKSSGLLVMGPIGGAFVEPDEKKLVKQPEAVQYSILAAGAASNIITGIIALLISGLVLAPLLSGITSAHGVEVMSATPQLPAYEAGLREGMIITGVNGMPVNTSSQLSAALDNVTPNQSVLLTAGGEQYNVTTAQNPSDANSTKGYVGITMRTRLDSKYPGMHWAVISLSWLVEFFKWFFLLSLGIGMANLLPIGPVDGGRMLQLATRGVAKDKKRGDWWWAKISVVVLGIILVLLAAFFLKPFF